MDIDSYRFYGLFFVLLLDVAAAEDEAVGSIRIGTAIRQGPERGQGLGVP